MITIVGAGPVGCVAALVVARAGEKVTLVRRASSRFAGACRSVECVPAPLLTLLLELGVLPKELGVASLERARRVAWEGNEPVEVRTRAVAQVSRPELDRALFARARAHPNVTVVEHSPDASIDATGRRAVTARRRVAPDEKWIAWAWTVARERAPFAMAALPGGYAYAVGDTLGLVGPRYRARDVADAARAIVGGGAAWMLEGVGLGDARMERPRVASLAWTEGDGVRLGDAACARDALSSQGLAIGISDAMYARDPSGLPARQERERRAHARALLETIARCRFRREPAWRAYAAWLRDERSPSLVSNGTSTSAAST